LSIGVAQRIATAEFLAELVAISPFNFRPPLINKLAIFFDIFRKY
jgi:hypothetical protein